MAGHESEKLSEAHPMNSDQEELLTTPRNLSRRQSKKSLRLKDFSSLKSFRVADLGCSVGINTFFAVRNIIEAVELKCQSQQGLDFHRLEYQVFFNDHSSNDFNTLFMSLPRDRRYYALGVPGSFYQRLFPVVSLHLIHSSYALHWLSKVPKEAIDRSSLAWNKGRIHYTNGPAAVVNAYTAQYANDMENFLHSRAQEIIGGGLMLLTIPCRPNGIPHSRTLPSKAYDLLTSCLMDLAKKGLTSEEKVDSFNIPIYNASPQELEVAISKNGCFSIEGIENLPRVQRQEHDSVSKSPLFTSHVRAAMGALFADHFGHEILDELFQLYQEKLEESSIFELGSSTNAINLFLLVKRKTTC
ncbi:unnamed protein product [Dovyalis caffra]|uniref:S-adenosylmethionine-dependent methyltransferase n=1 Tax=Dovyalis caffra TaxID=77055 RepID=A0AAV1SDZ6_9ROSI|nr:unnamed protein product [Dovyalis caffra]